MHVDPDGLVRPSQHPAVHGLGHQAAHKGHLTLLEHICRNRPHYKRRDRVSAALKLGQLVVVVAQDTPQNHAAAGLHQTQRAGGLGT